MKFHMAKKKHFTLSPAAINAIEETVQQALDLIIAGINSQPELKAAHTPQQGKMLNIEEVLEIVPVSQSTLFRMVKEGKFPKGKLISPNRRVWQADQVKQWQGDLPVERTPRRHRRRASHADNS